MFTKDRQPSGSDVFLDAIKTRRSYYGLSHHSTISDQRLVGIVNQAVLHTPSSFNSQTTRVLVLLGTEHRHLWREIVTPAVKAVAPESAWETTEKKLEGFYKAHGTVIIFLSKIHSSSPREEKKENKNLISRLLNLPSYSSSSSFFLFSCFRCQVQRTSD